MSEDWHLRSFFHEIGHGDAPDGFAMFVECARVSPVNGANIRLNKAELIKDLDCGRSVQYVILSGHFTDVGRKLHSPQANTSTAFLIVNGPLKNRNIVSLSQHSSAEESCDAGSDYNYVESFCHVVKYLSFIALSSIVIRCRPAQFRKRLAHSAYDIF